MPSAWRVDDGVWLFCEHLQDFPFAFREMYSLKMINDGTGQVFISPDEFQGEVNNLMVLKKRRITVN